MKNKLSILLFFFVAQVIFAQKAHDLLQEGDKLYQEQKYSLAAERYAKAKEQNYDKYAQSSHNLGNSYYQQSQFDKAAQEYSDAITGAKKPELAAKSLYNLGNSLFQQKKYKESIEEYKKALRINPNDVDAKKNLLLAKKQLQQEQQQNQQNDKQDKNNQQKQQENKQNQENKQAQADNKQQEQQQKDRQQQEQQKEQQRQQKEQLLKIIAEEERRVHQKLSQQKKQPSTKTNGKDW